MIFQLNLLTRNLIIDVSKNIKDIDHFKAERRNWPFSLIKKIQACWCYCCQLLWNCQIPFKDISYGDDNQSSRDGEPEVGELGHGHASPAHGDLEVGPCDVGREPDVLVPEPFREIHRGGHFSSCQTRLNDHNEDDDVVDDKNLMSLWY